MYTLLTDETQGPPLTSKATIVKFELALSGAPVPVYELSLELSVGGDSFASGHVDVYKQSSTTELVSACTTYDRIDLYSTLISDDTTVSTEARMYFALSDAYDQCIAINSNAD